VKKGRILLVEVGERADFESVRCRGGGPEQIGKIENSFVIIERPINLFCAFLK